MSNVELELQEIVKTLPPEKIQEVKDFAEFLKGKKDTGTRYLKLDWAGGLSDLKEQYTSVELQHKINDWRIREISS